MPLRVLFFGTPAFAVPTLLALTESRHVVAGVVTQPDRPRGRGHKVQIEAVKQAALERGLPIWQPDQLNDPGFLAALASERPDLGVVAAYGRILPQVLLDVPRLGMINVHGSLLPRWRGAAPVHRAILAGDTESGVTIMRVVLALDAGPMLAHASTPIDPNETSADLDARIAALGASLIPGVVDALEHGSIAEIPQDESRVTYASKLEKAESPVDWSAPADMIHNKIRGLHPWPLASSTLGGRRLLLLRSVVHDAHAGSAAPGTVLAAAADGIVVAAQPGAVRLLELQPEGRRAMTARDFLNGTRLAPGARFE